MNRWGLGVLWLVAALPVAASFNPALSPDVPSMAREQGRSVLLSEQVIDLSLSDAVYLGLRNNRGICRPWEGLAEGVHVFRDAAQGLFDQLRGTVHLDAVLDRTLGLLPRSLARPSQNCAALNTALKTVGELRGPFCQP